MIPEALRKHAAATPPDKSHRLVACNSGIGIALMYHEACMKESFD
jgi:hypothetical protein